jgi:hypothetical protein
MSFLWEKNVETFVTVIKYEIEFNYSNDLIEVGIGEVGMGFFSHCHSFNNSTLEVVFKVIQTIFKQEGFAT